MSIRKNKRKVRRTPDRGRKRRLPASRQERDEELALLRRVKRGNVPARRELLERYAGWMQSLGRKYHGLFPGIEAGEIVAEGNRGIIQAIDRFDPSKGVRFSTYAWFWILKNIQEYIRQTVSLIDMPPRAILELRRIVASMNREIMRGKEPSLEKISRQLGIAPAVIQERLADRRNISNPLSLDKFLNDDDREETVGDMVADQHLEAIQQLLEDSDEKLNISAVLGHLSPLEQEIIAWRFGFKDQGRHSLSEIAGKLKISPSKVKDVEAVALMKLKRLMAGDSR